MRTHILSTHIRRGRIVFVFRRHSIGEQVVVVEMKNRHVLRLGRAQTQQAVAFDGAVRRQLQRFFISHNRAFDVAAALQQKPQHRIRRRQDGRKRNRLAARHNRAMHVFLLGQMQRAIQKLSRATLVNFARRQ